MQRPSLLMHGSHVIVSTTGHHENYLRYFRMLICLNPDSPEFFVTALGPLRFLLAAAISAIIDELFTERMCTIGVEICYRAWRQTEGGAPCNDLSYSCVCWYRHAQPAVAMDLTPAAVR